MHIITKPETETAKPILWHCVDFYGLVTNKLTFSPPCQVRWTTKKLHISAIVRARYLSFLLVQPHSVNAFFLTSFNGPTSGRDMTVLLSRTWDSMTRTRTRTWCPRTRTWKLVLEDKDFPQEQQHCC